MSIGCFIVVDGVNGAGKTTVCRLLAERIRSAAPERRVVVMHDPGGTQLADDIRKMVKDPSYGMAKEAQFFLYCAARADLSKKVCRITGEGGVVVMDRWWPSTMAYQTGVPKSLMVNATQYSTFGSTMFAPVGTTYAYAILDCAPTVSAERAGIGKDGAGTEDGGDRFERKGVAFAAELRVRYLDIAREYVIPVFDATNSSAEDISQDIFQNHLLGPLGIVA